MVFRFRFKIVRLRFIMRSNVRRMRADVRMYV
jgi:hypothetical protein